MKLVRTSEEFPLNIDVELDRFGKGIFDKYFENNWFPDLGD